MKTSAYVRVLAVAAVAMAPFAAFGQDTATSQACVDAFVAQNFPGQTPTIKVENDLEVRLPLSLFYSVRSMQLIAADHVSGRVLATATCTHKSGVVKLVPSYSAALIAAR